MKLKKLDIQKLEIPFKTTFKHASASRSQTESILVVSQSENGPQGFGEGCPRSYVTGETTETAHKFFIQHQPALLNINGLSQLRAWIADHSSEINQNPAAWCAIELSLLDLFGKVNGQSLEGLLSLAELSGEFNYTAVLGIDGLSGFKKQLGQYSALGFSDFKIKVSGNLAEDNEKVSILKSLDIQNLRIRLDANNLWQNADQVVDYIGKLNFSVFALEEPLKSGDFEGFRKIYEALKMPIILDESFSRLEQFKNIQSSPATWIINLRVSKMGGLLRSLSIADQAKSLGIPVIIGAQVGETSILSRAALTVANSFRNILIAQEGAFGTNLLEYDITDQPIMFGQGGILSQTKKLTGFGLGIEIISSSG